MLPEVLVAGDFVAGRLYSWLERGFCEGKLWYDLGFLYFGSGMLCAVPGGRSIVRFEFSAGFFILSWPNAELPDLVVAVRVVTGSPICPLLRVADRVATAPEPSATAAFLLPTIIVLLSSSTPRVALRPAVRGIVVPPAPPVLGP